MKTGVKVQKRVLIILVVGVVVLLFIGSLIALFVTAKLAQNLANKEPTYTAKELYDHAATQINSGNYTLAEQYLEKALSEEDDSSYRNQLAVVKYRLKKYGEAIDEYNKLIAASKDVPFAWNGIGNAYRDWAQAAPDQQTEYEQNAINAYKKAISVNEGYVAAYSNLALLYNSQGHKDLALQTLDQGISATKSSELERVKSTISTP